MSRKNDNIISWSGTPWNVTTGCTKVSEGCSNCYAERDAIRNQRNGSQWYRNGFRLTLHHERLEQPLRWQRPRRVFVCSMSDLFHEDIPNDFIFEVFKIMARAPHHQFMVLTKRSKRMSELTRNLTWSSNIAAGVTVENNRRRYRIDDLRKTDAKIKYVSVEPMLGPINSMDLEDLDWVIVGGESGPGARMLEVSWVRNIRDQVKAKGIPFLFKQWGGKDRGEAGCLLDGCIWDERPELLV